MSKCLGPISFFQGLFSFSLLTEAMDLLTADWMDFPTFQRSKDSPISFETWDEDIFGWVARTMGGITYLALANQFFWRWWPEHRKMHRDSGYSVRNVSKKKPPDQNRIVSFWCQNVDWIPDQSWIQALFGCHRLRKPQNPRQPENVWESRISAFKLCWHWEAPTALPSKLGLAVSISAVAQVGQEFERWILVKLAIRLYSLCRSNAQVYRYAFIIIYPEYEIGTVGTDFAESLRK